MDDDEPSKKKKGPAASKRKQVGQVDDDDEPPVNSRKGARAAKRKQVDEDSHDAYAGDEESKKRKRVDDGNTRPSKKVICVCTLFATNEFFQAKVFKPTPKPKSMSLKDHVIRNRK